MDLPQGYQESLFSRYWTSEICVLLGNPRTNKLQLSIKSVHRHPISFEESFVVMSEVWILLDREGHGHKAVLYKSHFPATKAFTSKRHHCIHRLINNVYTKDQDLCYSLPHDMVAARIKH